MPTRRALGKIRGGNVDEALSLVHVGARSSQRLWGSCRLVYLLVALPGQPSPCCDAQVTSSMSFRNKPLQRSPTDPSGNNTLPPAPRNKYSQSHQTTAPLHQQGSLQWHVGSRRNKCKSQLASPTVSTTSLQLPSLPLGSPVLFTWL